MSRSLPTTSAPRAPTLAALVALVALVATVALAALVQGCAGESLAAPRYCEPGATQLCACGGGQQGVQICDDIGQSWLACGCANAPPTPSSDSGAPSFDGAATAPADAAAPGSADASPPPPSPAQTGKQSCAEVDQCVIRCAPDDVSCQQGCLAKGSAAARAAAQALDSCAKGARAGTCQLICASAGPQNACDSCVDVACRQQVIACYGP